MWERYRFLAMPMRKGTVREAESVIKRVAEDIFLATFLSNEDFEYEIGYIEDKPVLFLFPKDAKGGIESEDRDLV